MLYIPLCHKEQQLLRMIPTMTFQSVVVCVCCGCVYRCVFVVVSFVVVFCVVYGVLRSESAHCNLELADACC